MLCQPKVVRYRKTLHNFSKCIALLLLFSFSFLARWGKRSWTFQIASFWLLLSPDTSSKSVHRREFTGLVLYIVTTRVHGLLDSPLGKYLATSHGEPTRKLSSSGVTIATSLVIRSAVTTVSCKLTLRNWFKNVDFLTFPPPKDFPKPF